MDLIWTLGRAVVELEGGQRRLSIISPDRNEYLAQHMLILHQHHWARVMADEHSWEVCVMVKRGSKPLGEYWISIDGDIEEWKPYLKNDGQYNVYARIPHSTVMAYIEEHHGKPVPEEVEEDG